MSESDVPDFTATEMRTLLYVKQVNQETQNKKPVTMKQLVDAADYPSRNFTRGWKSLQPQGLINREVDGKNTRLSLTTKGARVAEKLMEINEVLEQ